MANFLDKSGDLSGVALPDHISFGLFEAPNPFRNASADQRMEALEQLATDSANQLQQATQSLLTLVHSCDPLALLSHFAFYDLTFPYSRKSEYQPLQQHHVEFLQALTLAVPSAEQCHMLPSAAQRLEAKRLLEDSARTFMIHRYRPGALTPTDLVREQVRSATQAIRNPGYSDQIEKNLIELFSPLDRDLLEYRGVTFSGLIALWKYFVSTVQSRINAFPHLFKRIRQQQTIDAALAIFSEESGVEQDVIESFRSRARENKATVADLAIGLWQFSEAGHANIFIVTLEELVENYPGNVVPARVAEALQRWSLKFGELQGRKIDHLFLDNPIWTKPMIQLGDETYFWPIVGTFVSFGVELLEEQMKGNARLKERYHAHRSELLERSVEGIVKNVFPGATVHSNIKWHDPKEGETDILVLVDGHALIVECKSRRIKPSARRGGGSLNEEIRKLIKEPTDQGFRFMRLLLDSATTLEVVSSTGQKVEIPRGTIQRITRVNVLLDFFGSLACEYKLLSSAGLLDTEGRPAVTMSLVDLENIVWLLESPLQILHYLHRRNQLEEGTQVVGDEMDWLACYLAGMFDRWPLEEKTKLQLYMCSEQLDAYFLRRSLAVSKKVPRLRLSPWWSAILSRLEERKPPGWVEMGLILLSIPYDEQGPYREAIEEVAAEMKVDPRRVEGKEMVLIRCSHGKEEIAVGTLIFPRITRAEADQRMHNALDVLEEHAPDASRLLLMVPAHPVDSPYFRIVIEKTTTQGAITSCLRKQSDSGEQL